MAGPFLTVRKVCLLFLQCRCLVAKKHIWKSSEVLFAGIKYLGGASQTSDSTVMGIRQYTTKSFNNGTVLTLENNQRILHNVEQYKCTDDGIPPYIKLKDDDTLISKSMIFVNSKKNRNSRTEILLEGHRLINEAIKSGIDPKLIFFSRIEDAKKICWPELDFKMYKVSYSTLKLWSSLITSPGVLGIFKKPDIIALEGNDKSIPLIIVCDNIRNPGNIGSILRVAAGVGCKNVLLTKGCVDVWDSKVLRSGAGAHFKLPVQQDCSWEEISEKFIDDNTTVILADNSNREEEKSTIEENSWLKNSLPLLQYHKVDYKGAWVANSHIVLVLGGETEGLSQEACELAQSRGGFRLHIPLCNQMESLNASTALGVITFEMRHQYDEWSTNIEPVSLSCKHTC